MIAFASSGFTVVCVSGGGRGAGPVAGASGSAAFGPESRTTPPLVPAAALWMWKSVIIMFAGQLVIVRSNCAVAAVIAPVASFVVLSVKTPFPVQDASASAIAGTSFEVFRSALNTYLSCGVGDGAGVAVAATVGDGDAATGVPPQAAARSAVAARLTNRRIDTSLACTGGYAHGRLADETTRGGDAHTRRLRRPGSHDRP